MHEASGAAEPQGSPRPLPQGFEAAVRAEVDGFASPDQLEQLEAHRAAWQVALERLLDDTDETLRSVRALPQQEANQVVADFEDERASIVRSLTKLGVAVPDVNGASDFRAPEVAGEVSLQASWSMGRLVVWAAGPGDRARRRGTSSASGS